MQIKSKAKLKQKNNGKWGHNTNKAYTYYKYLKFPLCFFVLGFNQSNPTHSSFTIWHKQSKVVLL
jgi:hypothetical protein